VASLNDFDQLGLPELQAERDALQQWVTLDEQLAGTSNLGPSASTADERRRRNRLNQLQREIERRTEFGPERVRAVQSLFDDAKKLLWPSCRIRVDERTVWMSWWGDRYAPYQIGRDLGPAEGEPSWRHWGRDAPLHEILAIHQELRRRWRHILDEPNASPQRSRSADGSRKKEDSEWREMMRRTDAYMDEHRGTTRTMALAELEYPSVEERTLRNYERWWKELKRDNPDLAAH
jgi:hypothetical protein